MTRTLVLLGLVPLVGCARPAPTPEVSQPATRSTTSLIGEPGDPCSYERTVTITEREDGSRLMTHSNYWNPDTESSLDYTGSVEDFFGGERPPGYSAFAQVRDPSPARADSLLTELARWAGADSTVILGGPGLRVGTPADSARAFLAELPRDRLWMLELLRGCVAREMYRADRLASLILRD